MATEFLSTYDETAITAVIANSTTEATMYDVTNHVPDGIVGDTLEDTNSLWICSRYKVSFASDSVVLTVRVKFGTLVVPLTFTAAGAPYTDIALIVQAYISTLNSPSLEVVHAEGTIQLIAADWGGVPNNRMAGTDDTSNDQPLSITAQWSAAASGNSITHEHTFVVVIGTPGEIIPSEPIGPLTQVLSIALLNKLSSELYRDVVFYGEFLHHMDHSGIGLASITRSGSHNATWRDGASHAVAANKPRFFYSGATPVGVLINSANGTETLTIDPLNDLDNANTLFWNQNGVTKHTTVDTNPFNNSGVWTGTNNVTVSHVMKFNRVLTAAEITRVLSVYASYTFG